MSKKSEAPPSTVTVSTKWLSVVEILALFPQEDGTSASQQAAFGAFLTAEAADGRDLVAVSESGGLYKFFFRST